MKKILTIVMLSIIMTGCNNGSPEKVSIMEDKTKIIKDMALDHTIIEENN